MARELNRQISDISPMGLFGRAVIRSAEFVFVTYPEWREQRQAGYLKTLAGSLAVRHQTQLAMQEGLMTPEQQRRAAVVEAHAIVPTTLVLPALQKAADEARNTLPIQLQ